VGEIMSNALVPDRVSVEAAHILVEQNKYTLLQSGKIVSKGLYNQPFNGDALAHALRFHGFPGVVARVRGNQHAGLSMNGNNVNQVQTVKWTTGNVGGVTIIGDEPEAAVKIGAVTVFDKTGDLRLENTTLMNGAEAYCPLIVNQGGLVGRMTLYDIAFLPKDPTAWAGKGMKWNIRGHGVAKAWDCRNLKFHKAIEHGAYIDNHLEDSYFIRCVGGDMERTLLQITNRSQSGPGSKGKLVIMRCVATDIGKGVGGEGSDYTIVGNGEDPIYFMENKSVNSRGGSFVHWSDKGHGLYLTQNGYTSSSLVIHDYKVNSQNADSDHVMISGVEEVIISDWDIDGNKTAIALNTSFGGSIKNGSVCLSYEGEPSQSPGWKTPSKMKVGSTFLTDPQINALACTRG
jgi:hypothetical protein